MATEAAGLLLCCVFDGRISMNDMEIQRRPYHRHCKCALHKLEGFRPIACSQHRTISFPKKQARTGFSLSIVASRFSSHSSPCSDLSEQKREVPFKAPSSSCRQ